MIEKRINGEKGMDIYKSVDSNMCILTAVGRVDRTTQQAFYRALAEVINQGAKFLIVDLSLTEYMDSGGIQSLVDAKKIALDHQGDVVLASPNGQLIELFNILKLHQSFGIYNTINEAKQSFGF